MNFNRHNQVSARSQARALLRQLYQAGLDAVDGYACTQAALRSLALPGAVRVIAIGKAAARMLAAAQQLLGAQYVAGLMITKTGYAGRRELAQTHYLEAGHPLPNAASLQAGAALLQFIDAASAQETLLFLISGGSSSLVEQLPPGMRLRELQRANHWLLASGLAIDAINRVRIGLSCIKGGRLAARLALPRVRALFMSDVPGDDPALIGSGLLHAPRCAQPLPSVPDWLRECLTRVAPALPAAAHSAPQSQIVASLEQALTACSQAAQAQGLPVHRYATRLTDAADATGQAIARQLCTAPAGIHLWGGETTVRLPPEPGQGGRCQQLALAAAEVLAGRSDIVLLAAATDGSDGPGTAAGGLVDGGSCARGAAAGFNAAQSLAAADAGRFLTASGDLLETGPTGSNVNDLVIAWKAAVA